jgi:hypothetical protein
MSPPRPGGQVDACERDMLGARHLDGPEHRLQALA